MKVPGVILYRMGRSGRNIDNSVQLRELSATRVTLANADGLTKTRGVELLLRYRWEAFTLTGSYVHIAATELDPDAAGRRRVPLTPRNTAGLVAMWEKHGKGRVGLEAYYTGIQSIDDNPYRTHSRPYVELGLMGGLVLGKVSLFVNAENLLDVRQTRYDPLLLLQRAPVGSWTVDAWAPSDGRVINGGCGSASAGIEVRAMALTIGDLGKATGTKVETVRYYEKIGLLPKPPRTDGNYRA